MENNSLSINTIVRINFDDSDSKIYVIEQIRGNRLFLRDLISHEHIVLINDNNDLMIEGIYDQQYDIEIIDTISLTNIPEIDTKILAELDGNILRAACQTDSYIKSLCYYVWKLKLWQLYPTIPIPDILTTNDIINLYFMLSQRVSDDELGFPGLLFDIERKYNNLDILIWSINNDIANINNVINAASYFGNIKLLEWIRDNYNILPKNTYADSAIENNKINVLDWMAKYGVYPTASGIMAAVEYGHYDSIVWVLNKGIELDPILLNAAAIKDDLKMLQLLINSVINRGMNINNNLVNVAIRASSDNVVEWLIHEYKIYPDIATINFAFEHELGDILYILINAVVYNHNIKMLEFIISKYWRFPILRFVLIDIIRNGNLDTIKLLYEHGYKLNSDIAKIIIEKGYIDILKWMTEIYRTYFRNEFRQLPIPNTISLINLIKLYESLKYLNYNGLPELAATIGDYKLIYQLIERNYITLYSFLRKSIQRCDLRLLRWIKKKYGALPNIYDLDDACLDILKWSSEYGVYPRSNAANNAAQKSQYDKLKWLLDRKIFPDYESLSAVKNGNVSILKLLDEYGVDVPNI